jgi:hypothetical protein
VAKLRQHGLYEKRVGDLKPVWEDQVKQDAAQLDKHIADAEATLKDAKDDAKNLTEQTLRDLKRRQTANTVEARQHEWETQYAYASDAYRLLVNYNTPCLGCHRVGNVPSKGEKAPPLEQVWDRLRPQWTEKWLANPRPMFSYNTTMPPNFNKLNVDPKGFGTDYPEFVGTPLEQAIAVRDVLMNYPHVANLPINRAHRPRPAGGGNK